MRRLASRPRATTRIGQPPVPFKIDVGSDRRDSAGKIMGPLIAAGRDGEVMSSILAEFIDCAFGF
jgi:hypothetical protein